MANILPIIAGLGAAYFLMRKKDGNGSTGTGTGTGTGSGFGSGPGGDSPCHLLTGIWSEAHSASSPIAAVTSNPTLLALPLTLEAFTAADQFFLANPSEDESGDGDDVVWHAQNLLTEGLGCPWSKRGDWTPRMEAVNGALITLFKNGQYQA